MKREEAAAYIRDQLFNRLEEIAEELRQEEDSNFQLIAFHRAGDSSDTIAIIMSDTTSEAEMVAESILDTNPSLH